MICGALSPVTDEEKLSWINQEDNTSYIKDYARFSQNFFRTSCLLTAAVLRHRLTGSYEFVATDEVLTADFAEKTPLFQVEFSLDAEDFDEHIITVYKSVVYHSYYLRFSFEVRDLYVPVTGQERTISAEEMKKMIGIDTNHTYYYRIIVPLV